MATQEQTDGTVVDYDSSGHVVREELPDGTVFDRFDGDGRPTHGSSPDAGAVSIFYDDNGSSTWSYADGMQVTRNADGDVAREVTSDGAVFDAFTGDGKPTHGTVGGQQVDITYGGDGTSRWSYGDGTATQLNAGGDPIRQSTADGNVFDRFDGLGRPTHGTVDGKPVDVSYAGDGGSTWTFGDGSTVQRDSAGDVVRQSTADGATFDAFTGDGKPTHGTVDGQQVDISYGDDGSSVYSFADGSLVERGPDDQLIREHTAEGADFDRFNADGKPTHGVVDGKPVDIAYGGDGTSSWSYDDGTVVTFDADNEVIRQTSPDGAVFDAFNADGKPTHGIVGGRPVDIAYTGNGSVWSYEDGTVVDFDAGNNPVHEQTPDGTVYDVFDGEGRPVHGFVDGEPVNVTYQSDGSSVWTYDSNGSTVHLDPNGIPTLQEMSDGTVYDQFNADGEPIHAVVDGGGVDISYTDDGSSVWKYENDGSTVSFDPDGVIQEQVLADGTTFDAFDDQGRPLHGVIPPDGERPQLEVDISYAPDGSSTSTYSDGTVQHRDPSNVLVSMQSGGWTFEEFDAQGRPVSGAEDATGNTVQIVYDADGGSVWTYPETDTVVHRDPDGNLVTMEVGDWTYDEFDSQGRPTHGHDDVTGQTVAITYHSGLVQSTFGNGDILITDEDGHPISQTVDGVFASFAVEIPKLYEAIATVSAERDEIAGNMRWFEMESEAVSWAWSSPSGLAYKELTNDMNTLANDTRRLLDDAIAAMRKSYENYVDAERTNTGNLTSR